MLCLYNRLNGPSFQFTLCGRSMPCILSIVPGFSTPLCVQCFLCLFFLRVPWQGPPKRAVSMWRTKPYAVHCCACDRNCSFGNACLNFDKWEKAFGIIPHVPYSSPPFGLCLPQQCTLPLYADPRHSLAQGWTCTNLWHAINLAANKIEHLSPSKIQLGAVRESTNRDWQEKRMGGCYARTVVANENWLILLPQPFFSQHSLPKHHLWARI